MTKIETILKKRADILKMPVHEDIKSGEQINGLEFLLSEEKYAIDSVYVSEVIYINELTPLPCTPDFIVGIINVRGKILSIVDIKKFFNLPDAGITNLNKVIVVNYNGIELGILADEILGSSNIQLDKLQNKVTTITEVSQNFIIGITKTRLIVLDIKELLMSEIIIIDEVV